MNWDAVGAIGEILGAMGVIATLAFLAFQVRQNSRLLETNNSQLQQNHQLAVAEAMGNSNSQQATMIAIGQDEELSKLFYKGLRDYFALSQEERMRFAMIIGPLVGAVATQAERQVLLNLNDGSIGHEQLVFILDFLAMPGGRTYWEKYADRYPSLFREAINTELSKLSRVDE